MLVVVIGSKGFIGSHLVKKLKKVSKVLILEIFRKNNEKIDFVFFSEQISKANVVLFCAENPNRGKVNLLGKDYQSEAINNIKTVLSFSKGQFIYLSSSLVYGNNFNKKININNSLNINDTYTKIKKFNEQQTLNYGGTVLRLSNVYGPGMNKSTFFYNVIENLKVNKKMNLNNWSTTRDFIYIEDVINIIILIILNNKSGIYNVGTGIGTSIYTIACYIAKKLGFNSSAIIKGENDKDVSSMVLDISMTMADFNWKPNINIDEGLNFLLRGIDEK